MFTRRSSLKKHTDAELIKLYLAGVQESFAALEARHSLWLVPYLFTILRRNADVKDVMQNAWEKLQGNFNNGHYHEQGEFKKFIKSLAYRAAIDWMKHERFHGITRTTVRMSSEYKSAIPSDFSFSNHSLRKAMQTLSAKAQTIFQLHFLKRMTFKEIAAIQHLSVGAVTNAYSRALKKLRMEVRK